MALELRSFAPLAVAHFLTTFNSNFMKNALVFLVLASMPLHEAEAMSAFVSAAFMLPMIFLSGFGGQLADRYDKSRLSSILKILEISAVGVAALGVFLASYWVTLAGVILLQVVGSLFGPVRSSLIPALVPSHQVPSANAWVEGLSFGAMVAGVWFVGFAFGLPEGQRAMATAAGLLIAALSFAAVRFIPAGLARSSGTPMDWNIFKGTWRTLRDAFGDTTLSRPIILLGWSWFMASLALSTAPALVARAGGSSTEMSWVMIAYGVSGALAAQIAATLCRRMSSQSITALALGGQAICATVVWIASSGAVNLEAMVVALCFLGSFHSLALIPLASSIQLLSKMESRARSSAASNIVNALFMVVGGFGVAGIQMLGVELPSIYAAAGAMSAAIAVITTRIYRPIQALS